MIETMSRLTRQYYADPAIYSQEIEHIFNKHWLCVGRSDQIAVPGNYFLCDLAGENLIIVRDGDGQARALYNVCRHRGARLCPAESGQSRQTIQCPYHAWTYDLNGRLRGAPHMEELPGFHKDDWPLLTAQLVEWEGFLFVNLTPDPTPWQQALAPVLGKFAAWRLPELKLVQRITYNVNANWKLLFQNYSECYHCPGVHPRLTELSPYRSGENDLNEGLVLGGPSLIADGNDSLTLSGRMCGLPIGEVGGADLHRVYYYTFFPNMFLSLHPDYVLVHTLLPQRNDRTQITCDWLFHPESMAQPGFNPDDAVQLWDITNRQDWEMCELTQAGVASQMFTPGPYATLETMPLAFERTYFEIMSGAGAKNAK